MRVKIISGTYGYRKPKSGFIKPVMAGGIVDVSAEEAARLMELGVAALLDEVPEDNPPKQPSAPVATPPESESSDGAGENPPKSEPPSEGQETDEEPLDIVDGHFTVESLMEMKRSDMEGLAGDLGVDVSKCRNKTEIANLIAAVEIPPQDDGENPPELSAEDVVVS